MPPLPPLIPIPVPIRLIPQPLLLCLFSILLSFCRSVMLPWELEDDLGLAVSREPAISFLRFFDPDFTTDDERRPSSTSVYEFHQHRSQRLRINGSTLHIQILGPEIRYREGDILDIWIRARYTGGLL